jgi:type VI secretion system protein ImpL
LEEQLNDKIKEPAFVYEALKVYLMVGGQHPPDRDLIKAWMSRDWAENLYPGATNAEGRKLLEEHLAAMFDLETEQPPLVELDGRLITEAQNSLARLSVAQRAYEFLKSEARVQVAGDWLASRKGGPDVGVVFEAAPGQSLETVRVPAFFTYTGFHQMFIGQLGGLAERMKRDRWVLGSAGEQDAVGQQYNSLANDLLGIYSNDFITAWRGALDRLKLKKLLADKPKYEVLRALSAPTSPLRQLLESIRDETSLTKERTQPAASPAAKATAAAEALSSPALFNTQDGPPGTRIEAQFKPLTSMLEGDATRRPIDAIIANLNDIAQNLTLITENPQMTAQATQSLQTQVAALRNNAARMAPPFSDMLRLAAGELEGSIAASTAGQLLQSLRDQVTPVCQQTITNRYPVTRASAQDVPLSDFAKLFSPGGVLDKFFTQSLAPYADTSRTDWSWRKESPVARSLSPDTLKQFQNAAYIRDAFFQTGGAMPLVSLSIKPPGAAGPGVEIKTEVGGTVISSPVMPAAQSGGLGAPSPAPPPPSASPTTVQWPGPSTRTAISVSNESGAPSLLERIGPWSLFRMLEAGSLNAKAETATASFIVAGRELNYQISTGSVRNPLNLARLREFHCPNGI